MDYLAGNVQLVIAIFVFDSIDICTNSIDNSIIYMDKFFIYLIYIYKSNWVNFFLFFSCLGGSHE